MGTFVACAFIPLFVLYEYVADARLVQAQEYYALW